LVHLENIYEEFQPLTLNPIIEFSIFYHDIIYDVKNKNNEEESAFLAKKGLLH
jgi:predicted metal-dependent HD superfamily phosphohydrolase